MANRTNVSKLAGFSLVEVLVAMGIMGVLSFSIMSLVQMQSKSSGNMNQQIDTTGLMDLVHQDLNVGAACSNTMTMQGTPLTFTVPVTSATTVTLNQIMTGTTTPPPQAIAAVYPAVPSTFNTVKVTALSLQNFVQLGSNTYSANVVLATAPMSSTSTSMTLGAQNFTRTVRVALQVSSGSPATILGCSGSAVVNDVTASRSFNTVYQNTTGSNMIVSGSGHENGSGIGSVRCDIGSTNPPTIVTYGNEDPATVDAADAGFICLVPSGYYYEIETNYNNPGGNPPNTAVHAVEHWVETQF
jgi:prepilin-type N-terminal cleavage/methylation domain-containing protein